MNLFQIIILNNNTMSFYRSILSQAWKNTFKYKYLWIFGIFASLTAVGGSWEYGLLQNLFNQNIVQGSFFYLEKLNLFFETIVSLFYGFLYLFQSGFLGVLSALTIIILSLTIIALLAWLAISCQGALINSLKNISENKKDKEKFEFRKNIIVGHKNFWPVLSMNLLIKVVVTAMFVIMGMPLFFLVFKSNLSLSLAYIALFVLFIPVAMGFSLMMKYAISYQIFEGGSLVSSIKKSYNLFKKNWLVSLEMSVLLFVVSFVFSFLFSIALFILLLPLFITGIALSSLFVVYTVMLLGIAAVIIFGTILSTFQISAWVALFVELKGSNSLMAKIERLFKRS